MDSFFDGKCIAITGSTGFVGSVLTMIIQQKLAVAEIYLLVRKSNSLPKDILADRRINVIEGFNLEHQDLGLSTQTRVKLMEKIEIIYHCAALVQWNLPFSTHLQTNCLATLALYDMFSKSNKLIEFVHLSTSAVAQVPTRPGFGTPLQESIEVMPLITPEQELEHVLNVGDPSSLFPDATKSTVGATFYQYSKLLCERLLVQKQLTNPPFKVLICRLNSIICSFEFPFAGYAGAYHGGGVAIIKAAIEGNRILPNNIHPTNTWPVDMACNAVLAHSCYFVKCSGDSLRVVNMVSNSRNPVSILDIYNGYADYVGPVNQMSRDEAIALLESENSHKSRVNLMTIKWYIPSKPAVYTDLVMRSVLDSMNSSELKKFPVKIELVNWKKLLKSAAEVYISHNQAKL